MFRYILSRIAFFIPVLIGVSLMIFFMSKYQPKDPVETLCQKEGTTLCDSLDKKRVIQRLNLDKPPFYFNLTTQAYPKNLYQVHERSRRKVLKKLYHQANNPEVVNIYNDALKRWLWQIEHAKTDSVSRLIVSQLKTNSARLPKIYQSEEIISILNRLKNNFGVHTSLPLYEALKDLEAKYLAIGKSQSYKTKYTPAFYWYGFENQYHIWMTRMLRFDFGEAYSEGFVAQKIKDNISWTVIISVIAILLAYILAIPLGVISGVKKDSRTDKTISTILYTLYSLPSFWIAILLIMFFTNPDYFQWFPTGGISSYGAKNKFLDHLHHMVLPIICWTYPTLAFLSQQMRNGIIGVLQQDYIRTARAKGLPENQIIWKHAFRNALLPIITMIGNILPRLIAGSVVLEFIFGIPGMGKLLYDSIQNEDFPVVFAIVMLIAVLTVIGYLISDILYRLIDPRVKF